jgi:hypothetical protein
MTTPDIRTDMVLVESENTATIHAPVERVDIADWLLHLPDAEYQRCAPPDHIAAGAPIFDRYSPSSACIPGCSWPTLGTRTNQLGFAGKPRLVATGTDQPLPP